MESKKYVYVTLYAAKHLRPTGLELLLRVLRQQLLKPSFLVRLRPGKVEDTQRAEMRLSQIYYSKKTGRRSSALKPDFSLSLHNRSKTYYSDPLLKIVKLNSMVS
jgi:hypothetical protein